MHFCNAPVQIPVIIILLALHQNLRLIKFCATCYLLLLGSGQGLLSGKISVQPMIEAIRHYNDNSTRNKESSQIVAQYFLTLFPFCQVHVVKASHAA